MGCCIHADQTQVTVCTQCGRGLCERCADKISPPLCADCARSYSQSIKMEMIKNIAISVVLMIIGIIVIKSPGGVLLAGIPYGWLILNKMTPNMFIWMSWIGWIVYFLIKLVLAYIIGVPALAFKLFRWITELVRVNKLLKCVDEGGV